MGTVRRSTSADPSTVLFGSTRRRLLSLLLGRPDHRLYLRQIVRESGAALGAVQRELESLVRAGIVRRTAEGRQVYFSANRTSPIFPELQAIMLKTTGLVGVIRASLDPLAGQVDIAFVFGSAARGDLRNDSDVDVMVIGDASFSDVANALSAAQQRIGREVNPTLYTRAEFAAKVGAGHHFLTSVLKEPLLFAIGGPDELERLGKERLGPQPPDEPGRDSRPARGRGARPEGRSR